MKSHISKMLLAEFNQKATLLQPKLTPKNIKPGDTLQIIQKLIEGSKEKTSSYEGVVIALKHSNDCKTITLRRIVLGVGVEQIFSLYSPNLNITKKRPASLSRRSKLYFLRKQS